VSLRALKISSESDVADAIKATKGPLCIMGGGTRRIGNRPDQPEAQAILKTTGLSGIRLYDPGALTLVVGAGTTLAQVHAVLDGENQRLAFEPMDHRALLGTAGEPTIGGTVAGNISGPARIQAGACRDFLLGVRFVDGQGRIIKNGGRVMKNVTGYDLVKLMAGSWGTLGVLSEVSLKVLPKPETLATLRIAGLNDQTAVAALSAALGSAFGITGAAHVAGDDSETLIRIEGFAASVQYRGEKLRALLGRFGAVEIDRDPGSNGATWRRIRDVERFQNQPGDVWRISVKPGDGPRIGAVLRRLFDARLIYDWGGGLVWALVAPGSDVRAAIKDIKGHARLERAFGRAKRDFGVFPPENSVLATLSRNLRKQFDPRGILNKGLMG